ncbi:type IV pilus assembly protein PilW [Desulfobotulus alkaliphilus]|uniref:Type IV pilus assembly protein PilW n=1 Tax=Desulfobotulus alkaliphilus TaxID=622671 RepID=A0A562RTB4_9BACT|nr:PilW family protein [Desulfobotulus alkaliphilus]TWI71814.1 type IV pilus assembly protein PilW [Desulfobotulus alkaliphilus]
MKINEKINSRSDAGITLVELLIVLALSLVLGTGIYQVFVGTTRSYSLNEELAMLQEDGRMAMSFLRSEIRGAGYLGCLQDAGSTTVVLRPGGDFAFTDFDSAIFGLEALDAGGWEDNSNTSYNQEEVKALMNMDSDPLEGSDVLVVRGIRTDFPNMTVNTGHTSSVSATLKLEQEKTGLDLERGDVLFLSDCVSSAIFQIQNYSDNSGTITYNTGSSVDPGNEPSRMGAVSDIIDRGQDPEIFQYVTTVFYLADEDGEPMLFRKIGRHDAEAFVSGVESFRVRYGEDTSTPSDGAVNAYVMASDVANWENVLSVRIGLLLRSPESRDPTAPVDEAEYDVSGDGTTDFTAPGDRRMRMVFSGTVGLRNRIR